MNEIWRFVEKELERSGIISYKLKTWSDKGSTTTDSVYSDSEESTYDLDQLK
jgi:hypothetical protein